MRQDKRNPHIEWAGGIVTMPAYVTGEGKPYHPEALLWVSSDGAVLGLSVDKPGAVLAAAAVSLRETIQRPMWGPPHAPSRVRVNSAELATQLRQAHPNIEFICAPTPEVDAVLAAMNADMAGNHKLQSYLAPDIGPDAVDALFRAAAGFFRARPWSLLSGDSCLAVTIEGLGVRSAALSLLGQHGEEFGFLLFANRSDFEVFLQAAQTIERGERPTLPPHLALNFERGAEMSESLRKEIAAHRWEVASAQAYPWVIAVSRDLNVRGPTAEEVSIVEALARALPQLAHAKTALVAAFEGGPALTQTLKVHTHAGELVVKIEAPHAGLPDLQAVITQLRELGSSSAELDAEVLHPLESALVEHFAASAEASALEHIHYCGLLMDLGANYFGATLVTLTPSQLREILFDIVPRKVRMTATAAGPMIQELRALYTFLKHAAGLEQAGACLRLLGSATAKRLEAALNNDGNFGMVKSLLTMGEAAGFDLESREGIEAFLESMGGQALPAGPFPPGPSLQRKPRKRPASAKQTRRKAAKKKRR